MNNMEQPPMQRSGKKKGGKIVPALCNIMGTVILILVIAICLPMVVPRFLGYEIYNVVSGSMEPEIPIGSLVLVKDMEPVDVQENDIIAFQSGDVVITHRVVENHTVEGEFITKGDANEDVDMNTIAYAALIGKVFFHAPMLGDFMTLMSSMMGKIYLLAFALCGMMFNLLAGRLRARRRESMVREEIEEMER